MFKLQTEDESLIANNELFTYARTATGTLTTVANPSSVTDYPSQATLTLTGDVSPLIAISGGGGSLMGLISRQFSGGNTSYTFISNAPVGTDFTYHLFGHSKDISTTGAQCIIRNTSNEVTFADTHPWLLAPSVQTYSQSVGTTPITISGATAVAVLQLKAGMHYKRTGLAFPADGQGPNQPGNYDVPVEYVVYGAGTSGGTANFGEINWQVTDETAFYADRAAAHAAVDANAYTFPTTAFVCNLSHI